MKRYSVLAFFFIVLFAGNAVAADFYPTDETAFQAALTAAADNSQDDSIYISAASPIVLSSGLYYSAQAAENYALTIQGAGSGVTILDGASQYAILGISTLGASSDSAAHITVSGITFQNGYST